MIKSIKKKKEKKERERGSLEAFNLKGLDVSFGYCIVGDLFLQCKSIERSDREKGHSCFPKEICSEGTAPLESRLLTFLLV